MQKKHTSFNSKFFTSICFKFPFTTFFGSIWRSPFSISYKAFLGATHSLRFCQWVFITPSFLKENFAMCIILDDRFFLSVLWEYYIVSSGLQGYCWEIFCSLSPHQNNKLLFSCCFLNSVFDFWQLDYNILSVDVSVSPFL